MPRRRATDLGQLVRHETPRKRRRPPPRMEAPMTPMIDVVFNLLVFFLVATRFVPPEGLLPSDLPAEEGLVQGAETVPPVPIRVLLQRTGPGPNDCRLEIDGMAARPRDFDDLTAKLQSLLLTNGGVFEPNNPVVLKPGPQVAWNAVVRAYNSAKRAGYSSIHFARSKRAAGV